MPRLTRIGAAATASAAVGLLASAAHAEESPLPIAVEYQTIEGCPEEDAFWSALSARTTRVERSPVSGAIATLRISVIVTPQGVLGRLQIVRRDRTTEPRFVEAANCEEVVQALALTAALSVEGETSQEPAPPPPAPSAPPEEPRSQPDDDSPYTERRLPFDYLEPPEVTGGDDWETEVNAHGVAAYVVDENASLGLGGMITFSRKQGQLAKQTLGLGVAGLSTSLTDADSRSRFNLTQAQVIGCPTTLGRGVTVRPCAVFQVGILDAKGKDISDPESVQGMWWAPGLGVWTEAPDHGPLRFQLGLQAVLPLPTRVYQIGQQREAVTQTMGVSPWLTVGVAMVP